MLNVFSTSKKSGEVNMGGAGAAVSAPASTRRKELLKAIGPGILMAGATIGGSHLVASTQAGAKFGWSMLGVLVAVNLFKYPFFLYGERYTAATGETILHGFRRLGMPFLIAFFVLNLINAFLNIAGVSMITASLMLNLGLGRFDVSIPELTTIVAALCAAIIIGGRYQLLDKTSKIVMTLLVVSTLVAMVAATLNPAEKLPGFVSDSPWALTSLGFVVVFMGWMPAPIEVATWPSMWMQVREREMGHRATMEQALFDFHLGYLLSTVTAIFFLALGAAVIHGTGKVFSMESSAQFSNQLIDLYTESIGSWSYWVIAIAAFTTMFSTVLTSVDAYPRSLATCVVLWEGKDEPARLRKIHTWWIFAGVVATYLITKFFLQSLGRMLEVAMVVSFLTSPVFAYIHFKAMRADWVDERYRPGPLLSALSWAGIIFFVAFSVLFCWWFFMA